LLLLELSVLLGLELEPAALPDGAGAEELFDLSLGKADGVDGVLVEPDADEGDGLDGELLLEGAVLAPREAVLLLRSQPTSAVPSARDTAIAMADNLMRPP